MIKIKKSETADTRTCDFPNTPRQVLLSKNTVDLLKRNVEVE